MYIVHAAVIHDASLKILLKKMCILLQSVLCLEIKMYFIL